MGLPLPVILPHLGGQVERQNLCRGFCDSDRHDSGRTSPDQPQSFGQRNRYVAYWPSRCQGLADCHILSGPKGRAKSSFLSAAGWPGHSYATHGHHVPAGSPGTSLRRIKSGIFLFRRENGVLGGQAFFILRLFLKLEDHSRNLPADTFRGLENKMGVSLCTERGIGSR